MTPSLASPGVQDSRKEESVSHTPGPWEAYKSRGLNAYEIHGGGFYLGDVWGTDDPIPGGAPKRQTKANARLMASAPDLLAALKSAEAKMFALGREFASPRFTDRYDDGPELLQLAEVARTAIAKAEGKS